MPKMIIVFLHTQTWGGNTAGTYRGVVTDSSRASRGMFKKSPMSPFEWGLNGILCLVVSFQFILRHWRRCNCRLRLEVRYPWSTYQSFLKMKSFVIYRFKGCNARTGNSSTRFPSIKKHMSTTSVRTYLPIPRTCHPRWEMSCQTLGEQAYPSTNRTMLLATVLLPMSMSTSM